MSADRLPFDLAYASPPSPSPDLAALRARGRRRRHRVKGAFAGGAALVAATVVAALSGGGTASTSSDQNVVSSLQKQHPPAVGSPVTLPVLEVGWTTQAWVAGDGELCRATFEPGTSYQDGGCDDDSGGPGSGPTQIGFPLASMGPDKAGPNFVTFVRGPAKSLQFTAYGHTTTVPLTVLPTADGSAVEVSWTTLPWPSGKGYGSADITALVALDAAGSVVAQWHQPLLEVLAGPLKASIPAVAHDFLAQEPPVVTDGVSATPSTAAGWHGRVWLNSKGQVCEFYWADSGVLHECLSSPLPAGDAAVGLPTITSVGPDRALVGLVGGPVARVRLTRAGWTVSVPVVPLFTADGSQKLYYFVPLPGAKEHPDYELSQITGLVGLDAYGEQIATVSRDRLQAKPAPAA